MPARGVGTRPTGRRRGADGGQRGVLTATRLAPVILLVVTPAAAAQVNIESLRRGDTERGLRAAVSVDFALRSGNVDLVELGFGGRLDHVSHPLTVLLLASTDVGFQDGDRFSNQGLGHVRAVFFEPSQTVRPETFVQLDYDRARSLTFRTVAGAGLRVRIAQRDLAALYAGSGYMVEHERLDLSPGATHPDRTTSHRWTNYLAARLAVGDRATATSTTYLQPAFGDFGDARVLSDARLAVELAAGVSLVNSLNLRYDSEPPDDTEGLDLTLRSGLRFAF